MHLKKELTDKCRCTEGKIIGVMYIGMVDGCIFYDSNNKRCKKQCAYDDENEFTLLSCNKHKKKDKKDKKDKKKESVKESVNENDTETNISIKRGKKTEFYLKIHEFCKR